ncbi:hypothetical protein [Streptomyces atroolivaceus]|uniref:hypothetical protein n=1 Tax=Streptomyces atroolivaceus TaxID=66869 RepID=UPI002025670A|nr:hypothetical protein [Streptomyces atroolivaceus]
MSPRPPLEKADTLAAPDVATEVAPQEVPDVAVTPEAIVMQVTPSGGDVTTSDDDHTAWDDLGNFLGTFSPFLMSAPMPHFTNDVFELFGRVMPSGGNPIGQTPQPERYEQLQPTELPTPVAPSVEETPTASV